MPHFAACAKCLICTLLNYYWSKGGEQKSEKQGNFIWDSLDPLLSFVLRKLFYFYNRYHQSLSSMSSGTSAPPQISIQLTHLVDFQLFFWHKISQKAAHLFFLLLFLLISLNWTMWKYMKNPTRCRNEATDTRTGKRSGRLAGGARATLAMLRPAMTETLM